MAGMTKEDRATEKLFSGLLCSCKNAVQADIGKLSGELFRRVDTEGQSIEVAAEALGLGTREARTLLRTQPAGPGQIRVLVRRMILSLARRAGFSETANSRSL